MGMIVVFLCEAEFSQNFNFLIINWSCAHEFFNRKTINMSKRGRFFISHSPYVIHLSHSTYNKPEHQNIKVIVVVIIFGHNFQSHSLQNKYSCSCILITASNSEKKNLTSHLLAAWLVYSSWNTNKYEEMFAWPLILIFICIWTLHAEKAHATTFKRLLFSKTIVDLVLRNDQFNSATK